MKPDIFKILAIKKGEQVETKKKAKICRKSKNYVQKRNVGEVVGTCC